MGAHQLPLDSARALSGKFYSVLDPGSGGTMNPGKVSGWNICEVTTAAAENRALPSAANFPVGAHFTVILQTDGGDLTITGAETGNVSLDDAGEVADFIVTDAAGTKGWQRLIATTAVSSFSLGDDEVANFGDGNDFQALFSTADASNHTMVFALDNSSQSLHITDVGAKATDWAVAAVTDPTIFIHSNTTPATDYLKIGGHGGSFAELDMVGGAGFSFKLDGTTKFSYLTTDGVRVIDDYPFTIGSGVDAQLLWSTADATNHTTVLALGDANQALHITDKGAKATDWNVSADSDPTLYIHSNTTPATDYLLIGGHDGTTAGIDVVGGTTLDLRIAGSDVVVLTATAMTFAATCFPVLPITDTDGTVEGSIWYDASEDKLKFKTAAGVETITST